MRQWNIFFNLFTILCTALLIYGCAKRPPGVELPQPGRPAITFEEYLSELNSIKSIKFIFSIKLIPATNNSEELNGNASFAMDGEDLQLRVYSMGFLVSEVRITDGEVITEGKKLRHEKAIPLMEALRSCLVWWKLEERETEEDDEFIIIRNSWRKVYINRDFIPLKQEISLPEAQQVLITYEKPLFYPSEALSTHGLWFPSMIEIRLQGNRAILNIEKIQVIQN